MLTAKFGVAGEGEAKGSRRDDASRAVAAYLARRHFGYSADEVARALGGRDHGSVHAVRASVASRKSQLQHVLNALLEELTHD